MQEMEVPRMSLIQKDLHGILLLTTKKDLKHELEDNICRIFWGCILLANEEKL